MFRRCLPQTAWLLTLWLCLATALPAAAQPVVQLGIDVLAESGFEMLRGKRVGLVAHPASVAGDLTPTVDVLHQASQDGAGFEFVALFGPEHGVYGDEYGGDQIPDRVDPRTGLPVLSLYGETRRPSAEMLEGIDILLFDLQDIGARSYTYISTMRHVLEACAEHGVEFVVLDRPNPLGGQRIEGGLPEPEFRSFISYLNVPYVHGMTMGELALMSRDEAAPDWDGLTVVTMQGWAREMVWDDTGLGWVPTSPHIPYASSAYAYPATGVTGELNVLSIGVGYTLPFEIVGTPDINGDELADTLMAEPMEGVRFRSARFKPFYSRFQGESCQGVQVHIDPHAAESLYEINFRLLTAMGAQEYLSRTDRFSGFDKANGTDRVRDWLMSGRPLDDLFEQWRQESDTFREARVPYLLYE